MFAWQKNFESHTPNTQREVGRAKAKEPSVHQIEFGNESGSFTEQGLSKQKTNRQDLNYINYRLNL